MMIKCSAYLRHSLKLKYIGVALLDEPSSFSSDVVPGTRRYVATLTGFALSRSRNVHRSQARPYSSALADRCRCRS